jgi:hypothetical protein
VLINTITVAVARSGADLPGVRSPWASPSGAGAQHAFGQLPITAGPPSARFVAPRRVPAMQPTAVMAAALPTVVRTQNVHKTRVNAGGDGASGPHPEREPA